MEEKMDIENSLDLKYGLMCRPINYYVSLINLKSQGLGGGVCPPLPNPLTLLIWAPGLSCTAFKRD